MLQGIHLQQTAPKLKQKQIEHDLIITLGFPSNDKNITENDFSQKNEKTGARSKLNPDIIHIVCAIKDKCVDGVRGETQ